MRFVFDNLADAATLSSSGGGGLALPVVNLQNGYRSRPARTHDTTDWTVAVEFGAAVAITDIVLWRHNLTGAATWSASLFEGAGLSGTETDLGPFAVGADPTPARAYRWASAILDAPVTARSMALAISDPDNPVGYLEINRLFVGNALVLETPQDWGSNLAPHTDAQIQRTGGNVLLQEVRPGYRELGIGLSFLSDSERAATLEAGRANRRADLWVSAHPGAGGAVERDYAMLGRIAQSGGSSGKRYGLWGDSLTVVEI